MFNNDILFEEQDVFLEGRILNKNSFLNYFLSSNGDVSIAQELLLNYKKNIEELKELKDFVFSEPICFVENIFIDEKLRQQGIGTKMMKELFHVCATEDIKSIYLVAKIQKNEFGLIRFYQKLGFEDILDIDNKHFLFKKEID